MATTKDVTITSRASGMRVFHDARGVRRFLPGGESITVDAKTAELLVATDPLIVLASEAPDEPTAPAADATPSGAVSVEDLGKGGRRGAKPKAEPKTPPVDAADAASSDGGTQEGDEKPADDPDASATGEAGTPPDEPTTPEADATDGGDPVVLGGEAE